MTSIGGIPSTSGDDSQHGALCALFFGCFGASNNLVHHGSGEEGHGAPGSKAILIALLMTSLVCLILFTVAFVAWISIRIRNRRRAREAAEATAADKTDEPPPDLMIPVVVVQPDCHCVVAYELDQHSQPVMTEQQHLQQVELTGCHEGRGGCTAGGTENTAPSESSGCSGATSSSGGSSSNSGGGGPTTVPATGGRRSRPGSAQHGDARSAPAPRQAVPLISVEVVQ